MKKGLPGLKVIVVAFACLLSPSPGRSIDAFPTFDNNCWNFEISGVAKPSPVRMIHDAVFLGLNVRQTAHFQECIRRSGYRPCTRDLSADVEDGVRVALSTNHLNIGCQTSRINALGEASIGTSLFHTDPESVSLSATDALNPSHQHSGIWRLVLAQTIWHEASHTHGYRHEFSSPFCRDSPDAPSHPSMPKIIEDCMGEAANRLVQDQFRQRIVDMTSHRPLDGERDTLLKSLTVYAPPNLEAEVSGAVERWLEGPDLKIRGSSGGYLMDWFGCPSGGLCFADLGSDSQSPKSATWHIIPDNMSPDPPATNPGLHVRIYNVDSGWCLRYVRPPVDPNLRPYELSRCQGAEEEKWTVGPTTLNPSELDRGRFQVHPGNDNTRCLAIDPQSAGQLTITGDCSIPGAKLRFQYVTDGSQGFTIRSKRGERCLDIPDGSSSNAVVLQLYPCHGGPNQVWRLREPAGWTLSPIGERDKEYFIQSDATGLCLRVDGTKVKQTPCEPPCPPGDRRCLDRTSQATRFVIRGHGSVFFPGYGYLLGYGNSFLLRTADNGRCLSQFYTGNSLDYQSCASVQSDALRSLGWRFFRAR